MGMKTLAYITLFFFIASVILQSFEFFGVTSSTFIPYLAEIKLGILISLPILVVLFGVAWVNSHKAGIRQALAKRAHEKLERKITKELETEATTKNLTFSHQQKDDVISILAKQVAFDIINVSTTKDYSAQKMLDKVGDVWIGECILSIPFVSAKILADKMTELSKDPQYRKKGSTKSSVA